MQSGPEWLARQYTPVLSTVASTPLPVSRAALPLPPTHALLVPLALSIVQSATSVVTSLSRHQLGSIGSDASVDPGRAQLTPSMLEHTSHSRSIVM